MVDNKKLLLKNDIGNFRSQREGVRKIVYNNNFSCHKMQLERICRRLRSILPRSLHLFTESLPTQRPYNNYITLSPYRGMLFSPVIRCHFTSKQLPCVRVPSSVLNL